MNSNGKTPDSMQPSAFRHTSKGSSETILSIVLVLVALMFAAYYFNAVNSIISSRIDANLRESDAMRTQNVFSLVNRSIGTTWHIHTAQAVFSAADSSLGCGYADDERQDVLPAGYWYFYDKQGRKDHLKLNEYLQNSQRSYSEFAPFVCFPSPQDMIKEIEVHFISLKPSSYTISASSKEVKIEDIETTISTENAEAGKYETADGTRLSFSQMIKVGREGAENIKETTRASVKIFNPLADILEAGKTIVGGASHLSDLFEYTPRVTGSGVEQDDTVYDIGMKYRDADSDIIDISPDISYVDYLNFIDRSLKAQAPDVDGLKKNVAGTLDLTFAGADDIDVLRKTASTDGVVMNYDYAFTYTDGSISGGSCAPVTDEYSQLVRDAVATEEWEFDDIRYTKAEIEKFVSAIMQQESGWNVTAVSRCGAAGLNQFMPDTARTYQIDTIFEDADFAGCGDDVRLERAAYAARLRAAVMDLNAEEAAGLDARMDPSVSIPAAVSFIHYLMEELSQHTENREDLMKFAAAAYNAGPQRVINEIEDEDTYDDIEQHLPEETRGYVPKVMGYYVCYGGFLVYAGGNYYTYSSTSDTFTKRPFSVTIKARDHLPVIDCTDDPYRGKDISQRPHVRQVRFFDWLGFGHRNLACCAGKLYSCNYKLPGIPDEQQLSAFDVANQNECVIQTGAVTTLLVEYLQCLPDRGLWKTNQPEAFDPSNCDGDGVCEEGEYFGLCAQDNCAEPGDGECSEGETYPIDCPVCGDSFITGDEECDFRSGEAQLNRNTCVSLGFAGGNLGCVSPNLPNECMFDTSACTQ